MRYDYIQLLLDQLNRTGSNYRLVVSQPEFDFESPANTEIDEPGSQAATSTRG